MSGLLEGKVSTMQHRTALPSKATLTPRLRAAKSSTMFNTIANQFLGAKVNAQRTQIIAGVAADVRPAAPAGLSTLPTILVAEKLGGLGMEMLQQFGKVETAYGLTPEELCAKISLCDALIVRSATKVNRAVFEAAKGRLKVVGRAGVGVDNVDLAAATEYGCLVVNAPTANTVAAAEHGIALMCAMSRYVPQADKSMKGGKWERSKYVGVSLVGKTLAIMGFGKVGGEVARRARGLGMTIIAYDPYANEEKARAAGVRLVPFDEALATGDFFSLHMPLTPQTKGIFNDDAYAKMKPGARIINVARGGVIDDQALVRALDAGTVAMAALDVFEPEPPAADNPLIGREDVICTPHLGASTVEAQEGVSVEIAEAVVEALRGELSPTAVNAPMVPREVLIELQPFVSLSEGLGRAAVQLVGDTGFSDITIEYASPRGDDLDTRLLRAMVIKGVLEQITTSNVNIVNADLLAKTRGLTIREVTVPAEGKDVLSSMEVIVKTTKSKFSSALANNAIRVGGSVRNGLPFITRIGPFDVEVGMEGCVMLVRQTDKPGIISNVSGLLASNNVNISYMTVCRTGQGQEAIMAIGVDGEPPAAAVEAIPKVEGVHEITVFSENEKAM